ncbi:MAG TPA: DUF5991 domain-containing protein [Sphingomonas sp.]|nr:DUF5991 domain-containing protein [Sphingomonas sp.]
MLKSMKTVVALGIATFVAVAPASAAPLSGWYGKFVWEEALGRTGGQGSDGIAIFVTHSLTLGPAAGPTGCRLDAEGFQTDRHWKCTATPELGSVIIKLYKLRPTDPGRGVSGARLFRMTPGANGLVTRLEGYDPTSDTTPRSGRLFRRVG